jgi:predicted anti-sigma-YlaC factor YlaD
MMNCASFENRLTEMLDGQTGDGPLADLRRHAEECPACNGAAALVELAALPVQQRDSLKLPPDSYWEGFNASVAKRLDQDAARRPVGAWRRYAAVATLVVALLAGWFLRGWLDPGAPSDEPRATELGSPEWNRLEDVIRQATPEELADALRGLPGGWAGIEASGWVLSENGLVGEWIPDADELDEIDRSELMEWLDQLDQSERRPTS